MPKLRLWNCGFAWFGAVSGGIMALNYVHFSTLGWDEGQRTEGPGGGGAAGDGRIRQRCGALIVV
jgi:hypothetical protein